MPDIVLTFEGFEELKRAIVRSPEKTKDEVDSFLTKATARLKSVINNNPWSMKGSRGGVPVNTGNLRDTHITTASPWERVIKPTAKYAPFVHEGTGKMSGRPWLDHAVDETDDDIRGLQDEMLKNIVEDLAT